jgi:hypothetical protein
VEWSGPRCTTRRRVGKGRARGGRGSRETGDFCFCASTIIEMLANSDEVE